MSIQSTERYVDEESAFRQAFQGLQTGIWTAEPGIIQSVLAQDGTTSVQLAIKGTTVNPDSTTNLVNIVKLQKVPVKFFGGGGLFMTHPIAQGDDCLVVFARRCIDSWWQQGGVQAPFEFRLHDINDGFCIPGFFSVPRALANVSMTSIQLRSATTVIMDVTATQITVNVPIVSNSTITAAGDITAGEGSSNVSVLTHKHQYIPGSGSVTLTNVGQG
jgi:hypothetical protein